jgi:DNA-binding MurR/RpiR family transcriptional regulator
MSTPRDGNGSETSKQVSVLIRVRSALPNLRPAEQRVAQAVLDNPARISESSITSVARQCQTSETTVLRFCRAIGLAGYPELRIALARAAQHEEADLEAGAPISGDISAGDSLSDVVAKVTHADARAIEETASTLDLTALKAAVDAVCAARRIDIYGIGASGLVARDLHHKLHRTGFASYIWAEGHLALTSAALLTDSDVAIAVSHTGTTLDTIDPLRVARQRRATTIAVTNFERSPITAVSDVVLLTAARETTFRSGAMSSRIAQLAVVDCLFVAAAQRFYDRSLAAVQSTRLVLETRRGGRSD